LRIERALGSRFHFPVHPLGEEHGPVSLLIAAHQSCAALVVEGVRPFMERDELSIVEVAHLSVGWQTVQSGDGLEVHG
jgi:hypothetical protein